ncbi:MAG: type II secretion system F family protein [Candidatus Omnitrophica bacterium]|nr:type II secretion system F family protein [Candidatus Omnitrophota bacterium]
MPIYKYRVKKGIASISDGKIEALTEKEAIEKLNQMGFMPLRLEKEVVSTQTKSVAPKVRGRIKSQEITVFSRELASLFKSGVPILNALGIIMEQSESPALRGIIQDIHDAIKEGTTFSSILTRYPKVFSPLYVAMVRTGENSSALPEVLLGITEHRIKQEKLTSRLRMAMAYPILMALVGVGTIIFMFAFVIPRLARIYVDMGQVLPLPTRILLAMSHGLSNWWLAVILVFTVFVFILRRQGKTQGGKRFWSSVSLRVPILGKFILKAELSRFCRTLGLLLKNGVAILSAIDIAIPVLDNELIKDWIGKSHRDLEQGGSFGKSLRGSKLIPLFMSNLISVGEESGKLQDALEEVGNSYEQDTEEAIMIMSSLLEPLMILIMGLMVGFIVVAMLLPIFDINTMVR